jgi:hypothetical protein
MCLPACWPWLPHCFPSQVTKIELLGSAGADQVFNVSEIKKVEEGK